MKLYYGLVIILLFSTLKEASCNYFIDRLVDAASAIAGWVLFPMATERCDRENPDFNSMKSHLTAHLYGQHLVLDIMPSLVEDHWHRPHPQKPLVFSLHGSTGVGKNYIAKLIVEKLFHPKDGSRFVSTYTGRLDFPEVRKIREYQERLTKELVQKVSECSRHVFIFDEVDAMPMGVLDVLKPFFDYNMKVQNKDFRHCIFILISNTGQNKINSHFIELWEQGLPREQITYKHFEKIIRDVAFNEEGGFLDSENIKHHLIDYYIPFLPMEEKHIIKCIRFSFLENHWIRNPTEEEIKYVLEFVEFGPESNPILSKTGCKAIASKVSLVVSQRRHKGKKEL